MKASIEVRKKAGQLIGQRGDLQLQLDRLRDQRKLVSTELIELLKIYPGAANRFRAYEHTDRIYPLAAVLQVIQEHTGAELIDLINLLGNADSAAVSRFVGVDYALRDKLDKVALTVKTEWRVRKKRRI